MPDWLDPEHLFRPWLLIAGIGLLVAFALHWVAPGEGPIFAPSAGGRSPGPAVTCSSRS